MRKHLIKVLVVAYTLLRGIIMRIWGVQVSYLPWAWKTPEIFLKTILTTLHSIAELHIIS